MSDMTFAQTILKTDHGTFRAGEVLRGTNDEYPFCHCIILGFTAIDEHGDVYVKLGRPYAYATCVGTTSPGVLTGVEEFAIPASKLEHEKVLTREGNSTRMLAGGTRPHYESEVIDLRTEKKVA